MAVQVGGVFISLRGADDLLEEGAGLTRPDLGGDDACRVCLSCYLISSMRDTYHSEPQRNLENRRKQRENYCREVEGTYA